MNAAPAKRPMPTPPCLTLTLSSDLASWISLEIERGDVALRVDDELADRRIGVLDRFGGHVVLSFGVRRGLSAATLPTGLSTTGSQVSREVWSARGEAVRGDAASTTPEGPHLADGPRPPDQPRRRDDLWRTGPVYSASDRPLARLVARPVREFLRVEAAGSLLLLARRRGRAGLGQLPVVGVVRRVLAHPRQPRPRRAPPRRVAAALGQRRPDGDLLLRRRAGDQVRAGQRRPARPAGPRRCRSSPRSAAWWCRPASTSRSTRRAATAAPAGASRWRPTSPSRSACSACSGRRIPSAARLFLLTLAIVDDIGAILVIAVFYTERPRRWPGSRSRSACWALMVVAADAADLVASWSTPSSASACGSPCSSPGVHATLAGVAIGLLTPATPLLKEEVARGYAQRGAARTAHLDADELARLRFLLEESVSVVERLQTALHPVSAYVVLPVFALANAGRRAGRRSARRSPNRSALGIIAGAGRRQAGRHPAPRRFLAVRLGLGRLPEDTTWPMVARPRRGRRHRLHRRRSSSPGCRSPAPTLLTEEAKIAILLASLLAAVVGVALLLAATRGRSTADV